MGIDVDPCGNVIVATSDEQKNVCNLVIFAASASKIVRTLELPGLRPCGICVHRQYLYLADVQSKSIRIFNITDK